MHFAGQNYIICFVILWIYDQLFEILLEAIPSQ